MYDFTAEAQPPTQQKRVNILATLEKINNEITLMGIENTMRKIATAGHLLQIPLPQNICAISS